MPNHDLEQTDAQADVAQEEYYEIVQEVSGA